MHTYCGHLLNYKLSKLEQSVVRKLKVMVNMYWNKYTNIVDHLTKTMPHDCKCVM
jgi:hypothetical protein